MANQYDLSAGGDSSEWCKVDGALGAASEEGSAAVAGARDAGDGARAKRRRRLGVQIHAAVRCCRRPECDDQLGTDVGRLQRGSKCWSTTIGGSQRRRDYRVFDIDPDSPSVAECSLYGSCKKDRYILHFTV
jgi:hypothetical protein